MNPHLEDCEAFPLPCPNGCSREGEEGKRELKRKDIPVHLDNHCPLQNVLCPYWDHGCKEEMERRHTDSHEREFLHVHFKLSMTEMKQKHNESTQHLQLELNTNRIANLEKQNSDKDLRIDSLTTTLSSYTQMHTARRKWSVKGVKQNIQNKEKTYSDPFYVGLYKCQSYIKWDCNNTGDVGVFICIMKGNFDDKLHWPIRYRYTFVLANQINSEDNLIKFYEVTNKDLEKFPDSFKRPTEYRTSGFGPSFISSTEIIEEKYCEHDSITLCMTLELLPPL